MTSFVQPTTIHVHEHVVHAPQDWPDGVQDVVDALKLCTDDSACQTPHVSNNASGEPENTLHLDETLTNELVSAASRLAACFAALDRLGQSHATHGFIRPYISKLLEIIWPDDHHNVGAPFILPVDPCHFDDPNARFTPPYMHADAILTRPLPVPPPETASPASSSWVNITPPGETACLHTPSSHSHSQDIEETSVTRDPSERALSCAISQGVQAGDERPRASSEGSSCEVCDDVAEHSDESMSADSQAAGQESHRHKASNMAEEDNEGHGDAEDVDMAGYGATGHDEQSWCVDEGTDDGDDYPPICQMQLLLNTSQSCVDFPLLCAASPDKLYHIMTSALLQRRSMGVDDPLVGVVYDTTPFVRLALGWTTVVEDKDCVEVHIACASSASPSSRAIAKFDVRRPAEALQIAYCLALLRDHTYSVFQRAEQLFPSALNGRPLRWRLDLAGRQHVDPDFPALRDRIEAWRAAIAPASSCSRTTLKSVAALDAVAKASEPWDNMCGSRKRTTDGSSTTSTGTTRGPKIPERAFGKHGVYFKEKIFRDDPAIQPLLFYGANTWTKDGPKVYSASQYAELPVQDRLNGLTPCEVMFCTRGVIQTFYPRSEEELRVVPHLAPLRSVLSYFQPLELPVSLNYDNDNDEVLATLVREYNVYVRKLKEVAEATRIGDFSQSNVSLDPAAKQCIVEDILTSLRILSDVALLAANVAWEDLLESEGQMVCWDPLHSKYLGLKTRYVSASPTGEFYMRMEHQIKLPRNVTLDIDPADMQFWIHLRHSLPTDSFPVFDMFRYWKSRETMLTSKLKMIFPEELQESFIEADNSFGNKLIDRIQSMDFLRWAIYAKDEDARLSCCQEEPDRATCDVIAGIKIVDLLTADQAKVLNALCESSGKKPPPDPERTLTSLFETTQTRSNSPTSDPTGGLGVPDIKDVAQILIDVKPPVSFTAKPPAPQGSESALDSSMDFSMPVEASTTSQQPIDSLVADDIIIYAGEYKRKNKDFSTQCTAQACMYLQAAVYKLAALGIYEFPVFATATDGATGLVYTAWGMRPDSVIPQPQKGPAVHVYIASHNPPKFDIRNVNQAIQFAIFLLHIRHVHAQRAAARFEELRVAFIERLEKRDPTLEWTLEQQREELREQLDDLEARQQAALDVLAKLSGECASAQAQPDWERTSTDSDGSGSLTPASDRSSARTSRRANSLMEAGSDS